MGHRRHRRVCGWEDCTSVVERTQAIVQALFCCCNSAASSVLASERVQHHPVVPIAVELQGLCTQCWATGCWASSYDGPSRLESLLRG